MDDLFTPPKDDRKIVGDCIMCWGDYVCPTPAQCYPIEPLPEEPRK
jgi:hypothetical protein